MFKKYLPRFKKPPFSFAALGQVAFVLKETGKLAWATRPELVVGTLVMGSLLGLITLPSLYLNRAIIDTAIKSVGAPNPQVAIITITTLVVTRVGLEILRSVLSRVSNFFRRVLTRASNAHIERLIDKQISSLDIATIEDPTFKDRFDRIEKRGNESLWNLMGEITQMPQNILGIFSALFPIFFFSPLLVILIILLAIPNFIVDSKLVKEDYEIDKSISGKRRVWGWLNYLLTKPRNYMEPRLLGNSGYMLNRLKIVQDEILGLREHHHARQVKIGLTSNIPSWLFDGTFSAWLFAQAILAKITIGTAQMLYNASNNFQNYLGSLLSSLVNVYESYFYVSDLIWLLNLKPQSSSGTVTPSKTFRKGIEFKNVWFRYPKTVRWILKDISFTIDAKENVAIVGENGAGKTTLIKLLCKFYEPTKGEIFVDGKNITEYTNESYWHRLSALFQDFERYPFSARESIGFSDVSRIDRQPEIIEAAKKTGIHNFISELPNGYENPLDNEFEGGVDPSGGQWQRIALARTLFRKSAEIIILDEPTSNVDPKAEEEIFEKIIELAKEKILVLISHRFSTVRRADKIILIENGKLTEEGTHEQLMKNNKSYAKLFRLQAKGYQ